MEPDKLEGFLPENVTYDVKTNILKHTYADRKAVSTRLNEINIPMLDLMDESIWQSIE